MLLGTGDLARLEARAPELASLSAEPLTLSGVELAQITFELEGKGIEALFPPGLHPTLPVLAVFAFWRANDGPLGAFTLAQLRLSCRSGARPRQLLVAAFCEGEPMRAELNARFAFGARPARVSLARFYDRVDASVALDGRTLLDLHAKAPLPLAPSDLQFFASVHPARTPRGLRLVQIDADHEIVRAERGRPALAAFDAAAFGAPGLEVGYPVAASIALGEIRLQRIRYVLRPDVLAFQGTEAVA
jgi:hypothetical protein